MSQVTIDQEYVARNPTSARLFLEAQEALPSGVTHDARYAQPFPLYVERAEGSHKWDVDGHEYIDYMGGHGALILGHCHPKVVAALQEQAAKGTQYGACHELEVRWAKLVQELIPSAQRVRFVNSGTEAALMAIRLAHAYTGRNKILVFEGHYHGWHDYGHKAYLLPFDVPASLGIPPEVLGTVVVAPPNDMAAVRRLLDASPDIAGVILEPSGASMGAVPTAPGFLAALREETRRRDVLLIFDEVVTGFRLAPGGAQEYFGVIPDITALGKIVAGGLPGGAVGARRDVMSLLEFRPDPQWNRFHRIAHYGTFNANPLTATAGIATLGELRDGRVHQYVNRLGASLKEGLATAFRRAGVPGCAYGECSIIHLRVGKSCPYVDGCDTIHCRLPASVLLDRSDAVGARFGRAMRVSGVDLAGRAILSAAHTDADIARTLAAFESSLDRLKVECRSIFSA